MRILSTRARAIWFLTGSLLYVEEMKNWFSKQWSQLPDPYKMYFFLKKNRHTYRYICNGLPRESVGGLCNRPKILKTESAVSKSPLTRILNAVFHKHAMTPVRDTAHNLHATCSMWRTRISRFDILLRRNKETLLKLPTHPCPFLAVGVTCTQE
jgi:hypothetical protein